METIKVLWSSFWDFLNLTGVNTVVTLISIFFACWAAITSKKTKKKLEDYTSKINKYEFLAYVSNFSKYNAQFSKAIMRIRKNPENWNRAGEAQELIGDIIESTVRYNNYLTIEGMDALQGQFNDLKSTMQGISVTSYMGELNQTAKLINDIDIELNKISSKMKDSILI